jgi:hypothetical protein
MKYGNEIAACCGRIITNFLIGREQYHMNKADFIAAIAEK